MEVGEVGKVDHFRTVAAYDADSLRSAPAQSCELSCDQGLSVEFDKAFWPLVTELAHAAAATCR
jgi:hypothetical protein